MPKFKVSRNSNYTVMSNHHLKDKAISLKAKGLLSMMLSLPDTWDYSIRGLVAISKEGVTGISSTINELITAKYITRKQLRNESGMITDTEYTIREQPYTGEPYTHEPDTAYQSQLNTKELSTKELSTKEDDDPPYPPLPTALRNPDYAEVSAEYQRQFALQPMGMTSEVLNQAIDSTCKEAVIYALQQTKANINKPNLRYIEKVIQSMESAGVTDAAGVQAYASPTHSPTKRPKAKSTDWAALTAQYKAEEDKNND